MLGNPPWDRLEFEDKKYFGAVDPAIAAISGDTARQKRIAGWMKESPEDAGRYLAARRNLKSTFMFTGASGAFPLCAKGLSLGGVTKLQVDQLFTERFVSITAPQGRCGTIVPTQIATGAGAQFLFQDLTRRSALKHLYDFENGRREKLFPAVDSRYSFSLLSLTGRDLIEPAALFAFFLGHPDELADEKTVFALPPEEISLINPNTGTLPVFRTRRDADLTAAIQRRIPVLVNEGHTRGNPWNITFKYLFRSANDADLYRDRAALEKEGWELEGCIFVRGAERMLPLFEGKMAHHFDHRWNRYYGIGENDYEAVPLTDKKDPCYVALSRNWVPANDSIPTIRKGKEVSVPGVNPRLGGWTRDWLLGWRDVARTTDERTAIPAFLPKVAVGHTYPLMFPSAPVALTAAMVAAQSSLVFDFVARQKVGGIHMALMTWKQLPVPHPNDLTRHTLFLTPRTLELVYTSWEMEPLAEDLGDTGAPFTWSEDRRTQLRAELDAYFFHLYGVSADDANYILESFQTENGGLKNNEIAKYGEYRTKRLVLAEYDRMAKAGLSLENPLMDGENYTSTLTPPMRPRAPARRSRRVTSPPPVGGAGQPVSGSRAEAVARERERLRALRERRDAQSADDGVDGFTVRRWRKVGVFGAQAVLQAHALLRQLASLTQDTTHDALADALRDEPDDRLLPAVRTVLERADQTTVAATLTAVLSGGFLWLSEVGEQRLTALTAGDDTLAVSGSEDPSGAFALLTAFATDRTATFPPRILPRVLPWIPLSVLDDLIDAGAVGPEHQPWQYRAEEAEHAYLKARLVPDQVTAEQATALNWTERQRRDAFLAGGEPLPLTGDVYDLLEQVADGDASVVKELERKLPRELVLRLHAASGRGRCRHLGPGHMGRQGVVAAHFLSVGAQGSRRPVTVSPARAHGSASGLRLAVPERPCPCVVADRQAGVVRDC